MNFITPLDFCEYYSNKYGVELFIKRDDLYPFTGGSSKARKIQYIVEDIKKGDYNAIVTAGSAESNHARVVSLVGAQYKIPVTVVIHDNEKNIKKNVLNINIMKTAGTRLIFCDIKQVKEYMDNAMHEYFLKGYKPYYVYGGAHNLLGVHAFYKAYFEVLKQFKSNIDNIVIASGTGSTQAGLIAATRKMNTNTKIHGISVSRHYKRGKNEILSILDKYCIKNKIPNNENNDIYFYENYLHGGYGVASDIILQLIKEVMENSGIILDTTYTAKSFLGMLDLLNKNIIKKGQNIIFWHSGSIVNAIRELGEVNEKSINNRR